MQSSVTIEDASVALDGMHLLAPVSVRIAPGEFLAIRGENGAGKTTLLRLLAGTLRPSSGSIAIAGAAPDERDPAFRRRVAAMIGLPPFAADLTVHDHLALIAATWHVGDSGSGSGSDASAPTALLEQLQIAPLAKRFPHELSSGQTQLFGLALSLIRPSEVLVLDEPEQRLDPARLHLVADALTARREAGTTIIAATHSDAFERAAATQSMTLRAAG